MHEVSEDNHFLRGDLQRAHTRYVEVVDPYIPDITENASRVKGVIGIMNLLRSETEYFDNLFNKTNDDYHKTVATLILFTKSTESILQGKRAILPIFYYLNTSLGLVVAKMLRLFTENWILWQHPKNGGCTKKSLINLTKEEVQENRYEINKLIPATKYIVFNRLKEQNHIVLCVLH